MKIKDNYENENLYNIDFSGKNLENVNFINCTIVNVNFEGANLRSVKFYSSKLMSVYFDKAIMYRCGFYNCKIYDTTFDSAEISDTDFASNDASKLDFSNSKIVSSNFKYLRCPDHIIFNYAILNDINLAYCNLLHGSFDYTDISGSDFTGALLIGASFNKARIADTSFKAANLHGAFFTKTNLINCDLCFSNLAEAMIHYWTIFKCNLIGANLCKCDLKSRKGRNYISLAEYRKGKILSENIIGYKKCRSYDKIYHSLDDCRIAMVTLEIPRGAIVFSINGNKCRTNRAKVLDIVDINGNKVPRARSYMGELTYYVGDDFTIYDFDCEYNNECSTGIHFFMTKEEAEKYRG